MTQTRKIDPDIRDAGKRASDIVNGYRAFHDWDDLRRKWIALRLSDGGHDGVLYDSKRDAVRFQFNEFQCAYLSFANLAGGADAYEMAVFLQFNRDAYDRGFRLPDPDADDGGSEVLITSAQRDIWSHRMRRHILQTLSRKITP